MSSAPSDLTAFAAHVNEIEALVNGAARMNGYSQRDAVQSVLDGAVSANLRRTVSLAHRREIGAFFTGSALRSKAISTLAPFPEADNILDPTCGTGDLLVAAAGCLEVKPSLEATLAEWGHALHGMDIQPLFVRAAKARLVLLAQLRGGWLNQPVDLASCFPNIVVGDALRHVWGRARYGLLLTNPPYAALPAPEHCSWGDGLVSAAAVFTNAVLSQLDDGCLIRAILPDVLRSGSRYERWRQIIGRMLDIQSIELAGQFDPYTDVDVFLLSARRAASGTGWPPEAPLTELVLGSRFTVKVGTVVPHRDEKEGEERPYLTARTISGKNEFDAGRAPRLKHTGKHFAPPFVVVRRTSRPSDDPRVKPTLITGTESVYVENHLLVVIPNGDATCDEAVATLKSPAVTEWMNERMRCRHLTVSAVSGIPWPAAKTGGS